MNNNNFLFVWEILFDSTHNQITHITKILCNIAEKHCQNKADGS